MGNFRRITVFCGSRHGSRPEYRLAAKAVGEMLSRNGIALVYGGGDVGLMGDVANTVLGAGGEAIGVITDKLVELEVGHQKLTETIIVDSMHARKMVMASLSDAFITLPGGCGTMDEFFEALTWNQLGYHRKPIGLLNAAGYYDHLLRFFERSTDDDFAPASRMDALVVDSKPDDLLAKMQVLELPKVPKWMERV